MDNQDTRTKLIETTKRMMTNGIPIKNLTARNISAEAEVNLAMINYCFKSKDELLKTAVGEIVLQEFNRYSHIGDSAKPAKDQLRDLLVHVCNIMVEYQELTKVSIPYFLLNDEIALPFDILPYIRMHYGERKSEAEIRVIAFHLVYTMQLVFYRAEDFKKYSGIDIGNKQQRDDFINTQLDLFLGGEK
ncbi:MAG: TetR/AcrR family transcriptional regulator [Oscillospiraceae bacterium]|nr:TetR/AcrR family transcriptional regulator [Oscillospiraceae bacterium]